MTSLVAIGCSLGGLRALGTVLGGMPRDFPVPIAVVQHRASHGTEDFCAALQRTCLLRVLEAEDKQVMLAGGVYVAPAGYHLLVDEGTAVLSVDDPVNYARPSIDVLFESAADSHGARTVAVVLSGASHDGTVGANAVRRAGGRVIAQDPADAECKVMPAAMLASMTPDAVLPLGQIAGWLVAHVHPAV